MASHITAVSGGGEVNSDDVPRLRGGDDIQEYEEWGNFRGGGGGGLSEIEEVAPTASEVFDGRNGLVRHPLDCIREEGDPPSSLFSFDFHGGGGGEDTVYVAVGKQSDETTSMDALIWAVDHMVVPSSTLVSLIHVFPETKFVPTPLGKLPIAQVNPEQKENHMAQERGKRREYLQKFLNVCSTSQVKVDTVLIESDMEAKAILDLIPILNIRKLVLGTTKSNARRMRSRRGIRVVDQILQGAPEFCEVKVICEGKEMSELSMESPSPVASPRPSSVTPRSVLDQTGNDSFACGCFQFNNKAASN